MGTPKKEQLLFFQAVCNTLDVDSGKFLNPSRVIYHDKILFIAYNEILRKKSCFASLKNISQFHLTSISFKIMVNKLKASQYTRSAPKKMLIKNKAIKNPSLAILSMVDRIVNHSIYIILSHIYNGNKTIVGRRNSLAVDHRSKIFLRMHVGQHPKSVYSVLNDLRA
jgi:hypothetical protein